MGEKEKVLRQLETNLTTIGDLASTFFMKWSQNFDDVEAGEVLAVMSAIDEIAKRWNENDVLMNLIDEILEEKDNA